MRYRIRIQPYISPELYRKLRAHFLMAGGSIYDLQKNLGHHSVAFTAAVYGHLSQDHRVKESDRLTGLFAVPPEANVIPFKQAKS